MISAPFESVLSRSWTVLRGRPTSVSGATSGNEIAAWTASTPVTLCCGAPPVAWSVVVPPRSTTLAPDGGETSTLADETSPYEISVALSSSTGAPLPCAYTAALSGTPVAASQASSADPSRPPSCLGETVTLYAGWPATLSGCASEIDSCAPSLVSHVVIWSSDGGVPLSLPANAVTAITPAATATARTVERRMARRRVERVRRSLTGFLSRDPEHLF